MPAETVVVLAGGLSHERDVSLKSGRRVAQALRDVGLVVVETDVHPGLITQLTDLGRPVVLPVLHGGVGEDGALRAVLELVDVPYVGSSSAACRIAFNKSTATPIVARAGVLTPRQVALPQEMFGEMGSTGIITALAERIGFPMMVKPAANGSALGCTRVDAVEDLPAAMVKAYSYGTVAVVEEFITGTEVIVAVIDTGDGPRALPPIEIHPDSGVYDYEARYTAGATRFVIPTELPDEVSRRCTRMALTVHEVLGLSDLSRTDIIVNEDGYPVFLEVNVSPGMTETSTVPLAIEGAGLDVGEVLAQLARGKRR